MELLDMMLHRRSVRQYIPGEILEEDLTKILQAGLLSASAKAVRPWELIVIISFLPTEELVNHIKLRLMNYFLLIFISILCNIRQK